MSISDKSYSLGTFPTLELLSHQPQQVTHLYLSSKATPEIIAKFSSYSHLISSNDRLISRFSHAENIYVVGEFHRYPSLIDPQANHVVLDQVSDMGNLGTIIRTMAGFNFLNIALIRPAADIFHPKTIRASMGAVFQINFQYFDSFSDYQHQFPRNYYPFISSANAPLNTTIFSSPYSLIFGNESSGLPDMYSGLGNPVRISQTDRIDSLNLSTAVAIALHHAFVSG